MQYLKEGKKLYYKANCHNDMKHATIRKRPNGELGNGMKRIRVGMRGIRVGIMGLWGIKVGLQGIGGGNDGVKMMNKKCGEG